MLVMVEKLADEVCGSRLVAAIVGLLKHLGQFGEPMGF
jgi:hypothetical protein